MSHSSSSPPLGPWETIKIVGKGGSSTVYRARLTSSGKIVAVKQIDIEGLSKDQIHNIKGEIDTMSNLSHEHIIQYLGTQQVVNKVSIFLEYADRGSLRQYYQKRGPLKESQVLNCSRQILLGLKYLHDNGIAHRDIKCANCLLTKKGHVKLADFGASKKFESESLVSGLKGTPNWMSPEVIRGTQMTTGWMKADVWSLGCTVVEMVTGNLPFSEFDNAMTAMYHIANGKAPSLHNIDCSEDLRSFIALCCDADPTKRPTVDDLLEHPFVGKQNSPPHTTTSTSAAAFTTFDGGSNVIPHNNLIGNLSSAVQSVELAITGMGIGLGEPERGTNNGNTIIDKKVDKSDPSDACLSTVNEIVAAIITPYINNGSPLVDYLVIKEANREDHGLKDSEILNENSPGRYRADSADIFTDNDYIDEIFDRYEDDFELIDENDAADVHSDVSIIDETVATVTFMKDPQRFECVSAAAQESAPAEIDEEVLEANLDEEVQSLHSHPSKVAIAVSSNKLQGPAVSLNMDSLATPVMQHGRKFFEDPLISVSSDVESCTTIIEDPGNNNTTGMSTNDTQIKTMSDLIKATNVTKASKLPVRSNGEKNKKAVVVNNPRIEIANDPINRPDDYLIVIQNKREDSTQRLSDQITESADLILNSQIVTSNSDKLNDIISYGIQNIDYDFDDDHFKMKLKISDPNNVSIAELKTVVSSKANEIHESLVHTRSQHSSALEINTYPQQLNSISSTDTSDIIMANKIDDNNVSLAYRPSAPMSSDKLRNLQTHVKQQPTFQNKLTSEEELLKKVSHHGSIAPNRKVKPDRREQPDPKVQHDCETISKSKSRYSLSSTGTHGLHTVFEKQEKEKEKKVAAHGPSLSSAAGVRLKKAIKIPMKATKLRSKSAGVPRDNVDEQRLPPVVSKSSQLPPRHVHSAPAASRSISLPLPAITSGSQSATKQSRLLQPIYNASLNDEYTELDAVIAAPTSNISAALAPTTTVVVISKEACQVSSNVNKRLRNSSNAATKPTTLFK